ncbi:MAG: hypothetical protein HY821_14290 [Acidobacteria bacterium]|nr:hypothetical protein [Acidobacteriota bacterium]
MRGVLAFLLLASALPGADLLTGFRLSPLRYQGPGRWPISLEPVWVYAYPTLRLTYRATSLPATSDPVLTLRPGSVGPVTPGATNIENPFVAGQPVVAVTARQLVADGAAHTLEVQLASQMRTPQIDQLIFTLPGGARLLVDNLELRGPQSLLPSGAGRPALPAHARALPIEAEFQHAGSPATTLRGRESIRIRGNSERGQTLYLSLFPHFAGVRGFAAGRPIEGSLLKENRQTSDLLVHLRYADGSEEDQFPLCVEERRHVLLNRKAALYALELDPRRTLLWAELQDRSLHLQLVLFEAGLSQQSPPPSAEILPAALAQLQKPPAPPVLSAAPWHRLSFAPGNQPPAGALQVETSEEQGSYGRRLSLAVKNAGPQPQRFTLVFPSIAIRPSQTAADVHYVFPKQGAIISHSDGRLEAPYNAAFPLQFIDVFAPGANSGACLIVMDSQAHAKKFRLVKDGPSVQLEVEYSVQLAPGETWRAPTAQLTPHTGDWHAGFAAYRQWLATWYNPAGPRPAWLRSAFWARRDYPIGGTNLLFDPPARRYTYPALILDGAHFGGIDFIDISGWALSDTAGRVGDYPIELGGPEDLRRNVALGLRQRIPTGLYFEGYLIDKNSEVGRRHAAEWQMIDANGQGQWWKGGDPRELFVCPYQPEWRQYISHRVAEVARTTGATGVYLDEYGFGAKFCYAAHHGHRPGEETLRGEIAATAEVRRALDSAGLRDTMIYIEETPPDAAAPFIDAAFCYNLDHANLDLSPLKLNLSRFAFPDIRLWDMVSTGIDPRSLPADDFRLSLWHGNGLWLKGHSTTWYGAGLLAFIRKAHALLQAHAAAFAGEAEPLVESPHPSVFINRFRGGGETVYTLFNASYRTARFRFQGRDRALAPRDVDVVSEAMPKLTRP